MMTVGEMLCFFARRNPEKTAVRFQNQTVIYRELNARANRIANEILALGLKPGDHGAILLENCCEYPECIFGLAKAGIGVVRINYRLVSKDIEYILGNSQPKVLFLHEKFADKIGSLPFMSRIPEERLVVLGAKKTSGGRCYEDLLDRGSDKEPPSRVDGKDCFILGYTSGTTGFPKGAIISHGASVLVMLAMGVEYGIVEKDKALIAGPLHHGAPLFFALHQLCMGGSICLMKDFDPEESLRLIHAEKITNAFMVPTMFNMILSLSDGVRSRYLTDTLEVLVSAGSPLPTSIKEALLEHFSKANLHEFYGSTETGIVTNLRPEDQKRKIRCVGQPFLGVEVKIFDEDGKEASPGEVGEIFAKSLYIMDGYYHDEAATREAFRGKWCGVGDLAKSDDEGFYYIVDRKKDMIISGGVNIYPVEIEEVLYMHPGISEAAVIGVPDDLWGESVKAIVVLKKGVKTTEEETIDFCKGRLASYKKPKSVEFVKELPRTPSGKVMKKLLRDRYWSGREVKV